MNILRVDSSIQGDQSASRALTSAIIKHFTASKFGANVITRDLVIEEINHLSLGEFVASSSEIAPDKSADQNMNRNVEILDEFLASDVIVIGAPMYNFSIPSNLKSWLDRLAVAGKTFRYTENGAQGLAGDKRVIVVSTRAGNYARLNAEEHHESYLKMFFEFLGVSNIEIIRAEGLAMMRDESISGALKQIAKLEI